MIALRIIADATAVVAELAGGWRSNYGRCRCPAHNGSRDNLRIGNRRDGTLWVQCHAGCDDQAVLQAIAATCKTAQLHDLMTPEARARIVAEIAAKVAEDNCKAEAKRADDLKRITMIVAASLPLSGSLAERYLLNRELRPNCARYGDEYGGWPLGIRFSRDAIMKPTFYHVDKAMALVGICRDPATGEIPGIQRIFLDSNAQAQLDSDGAKKKFELGRSKGCQILTESKPDPRGRLGVAEGIESALAAAMLAGYAVWAAVNAGNLPSVPVPDWAREIIIFADHDARKLRLRNGELASTGLHFAGIAAKKWRDLPNIKSVHVVASPVTGADPADTLQKVIYG